MELEVVLIRLGIAALAGGAIGYEREYKNRPAGLRTHILVCIGACVISLTQVNMNEEIIQRVLSDSRLNDILRADYGRLSAQVISGIGFLGAGTIIHTKGSIKGLTTAATLWLVACLGLAIGYGYYAISLAALLISFVVLISLKKFQDRLFHSNQNIHLAVEFTQKGKAIESIDVYFSSKNIHVLNMDISRGSDDSSQSCIYTINLPKSMNIVDVIRQLSVNESVLEVRKITEE